MSKRHVHKRHSAMQGNGGRFTPTNGHPSQETSSESHSEPRRHRYTLASRDGAGVERHKGHKFSQANYESLKLGW